MEKAWIEISAVLEVDGDLMILIYKEQLFSNLNSPVISWSPRTSYIERFRSQSVTRPVGRYNRE